MTKKSEINEVTERIEGAIKDLISTVVQEAFWVTHYGANDIHPKHLVYWICVQSDREKKRLSDDSLLYRNLRNLLTEHKYPISGRDEVHILDSSHKRPLIGSLTVTGGTIGNREVFYRTKYCILLLATQAKRVCNRYNEIKWDLKQKN